MARNNSVPLDILEAFPNIGLNLIYKKKGEWAGPCPTCGGEDRLVIWEDGGSWCRHCNTYSHWKGRQTSNSPEELLAKTYTLAKGKKSQKDTTYTPFEWSVADWYHEALIAAPEIVKWVKERYSINLDTIVAARLGYDVLPRSRDSTNRRLLVPIPTSDGNQVIGFKGRLTEEYRRIKYHARLDRNKVPDEAGQVEPNKWTASAGTGGALYGLLSVETGKPLIHVGEGELKRLALVSAGFRATTSTAGAAQFDDEWSELIVARRPSSIYLMYDGDEAGRKGAEKAQRRLQAAMKAAGTDIPLYVVDLPEGKDINDMLRPVAWLRKAEKVDELLSGARMKAAQEVAPAQPNARLPRRKVTRVKLDKPKDRQLGTSIEKVRDGMQYAVIEYLSSQSERPAGVMPKALLLSPYPGSGKTTELVGMLEALDLKVFYAGPRRNMWFTLLEASADAALHKITSVSRSDEWFNLRSRSEDDIYGDRNCFWPKEVEDAYAKRRDVFNLICQGAACGMWMECGYSQQFETKARYVYGRHHHVVRSGLAAKYDVIVLDENCMSAFMQDVTVQIPEIQLNPAAPKAAHTLAKLLRIMLAGMPGATPLAGPQIVPVLDREVRSMMDCSLIELINAIPLDNEALFGEPLVTPSEVKDLGVKWFPEFFEILSYEARLWAAGAPDWNSRFAVSACQLQYIVLSKPKVGDKPVIIADATGNAEIYGKLLGREVEVYKPLPDQKAEVWQLTTRANGVGSLREAKERPWLELEAMIRLFVDERPDTLIVSALAYEERIKALGLPESVEYAHYGGVVGTNDYKLKEQVICAGVYMPPRHSMLMQARAIWYDDPKPISDEWDAEEREYEVMNELAFYPVGTFKDRRAALVLGQAREATMLQSFERIRTLMPGEAPKRVVLLTNVPIPGIEIARLFDVRDEDILGNPNNYYRAAMRSFIRDAILRRGEVTFPEIEAAFTTGDRHWSKPTIVKHRDEAIRLLDLEVVVMPASGRGRPPKAARSAPA